MSNTAKLPALTAEDALRQRAEAWTAVAKVLDEVSPGWNDLAETGIQSAEMAIRALAAQPVAQAPEWWPISTAPKDGTEIILREGARVGAASWISWLASEVEEAGSGWTICWDGDDWHEPTDWMPLPAATAEASKPVRAEAPSGWDGAEEWMPLAWELCAEENGEESCNELIWEGGAVPEPWGERWLKYEDEAKRLIALVRKCTALAAHPPASGVGEREDVLAADFRRQMDELSQRNYALRFENAELRAAIATQPQEVQKPVAVLRFERGTPGRENDMPRVVSCDWLPDGEYRVCLGPQPEQVEQDSADPELTVEAFAARLARHMEIASLTAKDVSELTGVSETTLSRLKNHGRMPDAISYAALCNFMGWHPYLKHKMAAGRVRAARASGKGG